MSNKNKLFLASLGITDKLAPYLVVLLDGGRHARSMPKGYVIENASDYKGNEGQKKLREYYSILKNHNLDYNFLDLKEFENRTSELDRKLKFADFIYVSGGNIFYLYYYIVKSGLDKILTSQINNGLVYVGSSAGSVIAGPTIKYLDTVDDVNISPEPNNIKWETLNLVDFVVLPHWGEKKYKSVYGKVKQKLESDDYIVKPLTNKQALVVTGNRTRLIKEAD